MGNQHSKAKEEQARQAAEAAAQQAAAEAKKRAVVRIAINRKDGTVDEFVQALPKMEPGKFVTLHLTPQAG